MAKSNTITDSIGESRLSNGTNPISNLDSLQSYSITSHKLNGGNYMEWSQSVKLYVQGKGKFGYLTGATAKPKDGEEGCERPKIP